MATLTVQLWETHTNFFLLENAAVTQGWITERTCKLQRAYSCKALIKVEDTG